MHMSSAALSVRTKPASSCLNELVVPHLSQPCKIRLPHSRRHFNPMNGKKYVNIPSEKYIYVHIYMCVYVNFDKP